MEPRRIVCLEPSEEMFMLFQRTLRSVLVIAALTPSIAFAGPFEDGAKAFAKNDFKTAEKLWRPLAEAGDSKAEFSLGYLYASGSGVKQDMKEAVRLWKLASDKNSAVAQLNLGNVYAAGQGGVDKDTVEASKWYLKAAQNGEAEAQTNIADFYATGTGVARNPKEALKWYKAAMANGYAPAFVGYGGMFERGDGVPKDVIKAHMYFNVAAATSSGKVADAAGAERDRLTKAMAPDQVTKARALARTCMSSNYAKCE